MMKKFLLFTLATVILSSSFLSWLPADRVFAEIDCSKDRAVVDRYAIDTLSTFYDPCAGTRDVTVCEGQTGDGSMIDRILKTLAFRESSGNPKAENPGSSASGKYQYLDGTWKNVSAEYQEARKYARAKDAPEPIQDAVAYIEYSKKVKTYNGDLFKIALSHFYPAAISDPSKLDSQIGTNTITPRQYADRFVRDYNDNIGAKIALYYQDAPNLPAPTGIRDAGVDTGCNAETSDPGLGVGKGSFTDSGTVKDFNNVLANARASDKVFGNDFVGCGLCASVVSRVWRGKDIGYGFVSAIDMWRVHGSRVGHADRKPKQGAILLYESSSVHGHVVIYLGNNKVLNDGQIQNASFESDWGLKYKGWIDPNAVGWTSVKAGDIKTALASKLSGRCN